MPETLLDNDFTAAVTSDFSMPAHLTPLPKAKMPAGWTIQRIAHLVRDLAMNIYEEAVVLKNHNLSPEQHEILKENEFFKKAIEQAVMEWNSPFSTQRRIAMESAIAMEDALPTLAARLSASKEPLEAVVGLLKVFSEMAGITGVKAVSNHQQTGEKFKIVINLGADTVSRQAPVINVTPTPATFEGFSFNAPLPQS